MALLERTVSHNGVCVAMPPNIPLDKPTGTWQHGGYASWVVTLAARKSTLTAEVWEEGPEKGPHAQKQIQFWRV